MMVPLIIAASGTQESTKGIVVAVQTVLARIGLGFAPIAILAIIIVGLTPKGDRGRAGDTLCQPGQQQGDARHADPACPQSPRRPLGLFHPSARGQACVRDRSRDRSHWPQLRGAHHADRLYAPGARVRDRDRSAVLAAARDRDRGHRRREPVVRRLGPAVAPGRQAAPPGGKAARRPVHRYLDGHQADSRDGSGRAVRQPATRTRRATRRRVRGPGSWRRNTQPTCRSR